MKTQIIERGLINKNSTRIFSVYFHLHVYNLGFSPDQNQTADIMVKEYQESRIWISSLCVCAKARIEN